MLLTSFLDCVIGNFHKLTLRRSLTLSACVFIIITFINGISLVPHEDYRLLSQNPFITRTDIYSRNYWQESVLLPLTAFYSRLTSHASFFLLCFFVAVSAYFFFNYLIFRYHAPPPAFIFSTILMTNPLTTAIFSWLGTPDV